MDTRSRLEKMAMAARMALIMEAAAEKPGNVTPTRRFDDMDFSSFILSANVIASAMESSGRKPVGEIIHEAVTASVKAAGVNVHLGAVLLLAPLAKAFVKHGAVKRKSVADVLGGLAKKDAQLAYKAIRMAKPGGLGRAEKYDVSKSPDASLLEVMRQAEGRDWVAHEYSNGFSITLGHGAPELAANVNSGLGFNEAVVQTYLGIMGAYPDSLVARKNGMEMALEMSREAARILSLGGMHSSRGRRAVYEFDLALRSDGNILNPGTSADLTAAALFVYFLGNGYKAIKPAGG